MQEGVCSEDTENCYLYFSESSRGNEQEPREKCDTKLVTGCPRSGSAL